MKPDEQQQQEKITLYEKLRQSMLPVKQTDTKLVKHSKNVGFAIFSVTFLLVSMVIIVAIAFVL